MIRPSRVRAAGRARLTAALVLVLAVLGATPAPASAASAVEFEGRGFGHGRGMSQWGARGAAQAGLDWRAILGFYYPGTTLDGTFAAATLRVGLSGVSGSEMRVRPAPGLVVDTARCVETLPASSRLTAWRVTRGSGGWQLSYFSTSTGAWRSWSSRCAVSSASTITLRSTNLATTSAAAVWTSSGSWRTYRGWMRAVPVGSGGVGTVNVVSLDQYVASVVPSEMPSSWEPAALAAQSVAARTYAARRLGSSASSDICDTTSCQVYLGSDQEVTSSRAAVAATTGVVVRSGSVLALTEFSAYNGGWVASGGPSYQVAKVDPYDGANPTPAAPWRVSIPVSRLEADTPSIGRFREIRTVRDGDGRWGGRIVTISIVGTAGTATLTGDQFRSRYGLRSTYLAPVGSPPGEDFLLNANADLVARDSVGTLWAYAGDGRGGWSSRRQVVTGAGSLSELTSPGDLDGDGRPDVLARSSDGVLWLYPGSGTGGLAGRVQVGNGWQGFSVLTAPGDLDGDDRADLLARDAAGSLWLYRGRGDGFFAGRVLVGPGWNGYTALAATGDTTGAGTTDVFAVDSSGVLWRVVFSASGTLVTRRQVGHGWSAMRFLTGVGDSTGDGVPDLLAVAPTGQLLVYAGSGTGTLRSPVQVGSGWTSMRSLTS